MCERFLCAINALSRPLLAFPTRFLAHSCNMYTHRQRPPRSPPTTRMPSSPTKYHSHSPRCSSEVSPVTRYDILGMRVLRAFKASSELGDVFNWLLCKRSKCVTKHYHAELGDCYNCITLGLQMPNAKCYWLYCFQIRIPFQCHSLWKKKESFNKKTRKNKTIFK